MSRLSCLATLASVAVVLFTSCSRKPDDSALAFELRNGDRVVYLGDTLIEREQYQGWLDVMFASRFPESDITFRNLGWSGDTPSGKSRLGLSLLQAGKEPPDEGWRQLISQLEEANPTVVVLGYGMANSFNGPDGLESFRAAYTQLIAKLRENSPDIRFVFLSPVAHESIGSPWPDPTPHNINLAAYSKAIAELANTFDSPFVDLSSLRALSPTTPLTSNGIHLSATGYRRLAEALEDQLFGAPGTWRDSSHAEALRQAVLRKNVAFFNRSRPANMAYIFGFRKKEQGNNATEVLEFDKLVAAEDVNIATLRHLRFAEITIPAQSLTNRVLKITPQMHPDFEVAEGLEVTLWAENPLINKPIHMNWDAQGRLWIAASTVYPQIEPGQALADRILVLADSDANGVADQVTTFADGLLIPTGVLPGDGGVYVAQSTELLYFRDLNGDGVSDEKKIVLSGFGTEDSHHNLHTPQWGPDGRLYVNQSVYTRTRTETPHGVVDLKAGGVFRFDPRDQTMSIHYRGLINGWGHAFDAFGQSFMSDGAGFEGISWGVQGATYRTLASSRRILQTITPGNYPKYAGLEIIQSDLFPADWQGDIITCDFRSNRVVRFRVAEDGAGFIAREQPEIIRTVADSFRPIDVKLGPDGALYVADWSNPIIQHGEVDFRDTRRDKVHGRIWRIAPKDHRPSAPIDYSSLSNRKLLDNLLAANAAIQLQARRVLTERGVKAVAADLEEWTAAHSAESAQLQALWLRQSFNLPLKSVATSLLASNSASLRAATIHALSLAAEDDFATVAELSRDPHPRVRLEAVRALARFPTAASAATALAVLDTPMDPFLDYALWLTINELAEPWSTAVLDGSWSTTGRETQLAFALTALLPEQAAPLLGQLLARHPLPADGSGPWIQLIQDAGGPAELSVLFATVSSNPFPPSATATALDALSEAARLRNVRPNGPLPSLTPLLISSDAAVQNAAIRLVGVWKLDTAVPQLITLARSPTSSTNTIKFAISALRDIGGDTSTRALLSIARENQATEAVRNLAAIALAAQNLTAHASEVIARLQQASSDAVANNLWRSVLGLKNSGTVLAKLLPKTPLPAPVAKAGLRPAREGNQNAALVGVLLEQAGLSLSVEKLTGAQMLALAASAEAQGDPARGEMLYRQSALACVACHAIGGAGGKVGPDLTSIGASAPTDYLVEALLYPGDKVKEGYHATLVTTRDDQAITGVVVMENPQEIILRSPTNQEVSVAVSNIASRINIGSLMPAGLIDSLLPQERLDLIKFLSSLGKPGLYDATRSTVARQWYLYLTWSGNRHLGVERVVQGDFTLPDWVAITTRVDGIVPAEEYGPLVDQTNHADHLFLAVQFDAPAAGPVTFTQDSRFTQTWLNGNLVEIGETFTLNAEAGPNTLVFRTAPQTFPKTLRLTSKEVTFLTD